MKHFNSFRLYVLLQLICNSAGGILGDGENFADKLEHFEPRLWLIGNSLMHSTLAVESGVDYVFQSPNHDQPNQEPMRFLQLWLRNNCSQKELCCHKDPEKIFPSIGGYCTPYTSGEFTSLHTYSYGTFFFFGKAPRPAQGSAINVWGCWSLRRELVFTHQPTHMHIQMCFPSQDGNKIIFTVKYGDRIAKQPVIVKFDTRFEAALYRIDWFPDFIIFHIGKDPIYVVKQKDMMIPDSRLHIKLFLAPQGNRDGIDIDFPQNGDAAMVMQAFQLAYKKADIPLEHIELFSKTKKKDSGSGSNTVWIVSIFVMLVCAGIALYLFWSRRRQTSEAYYDIILDDEPN